MPPIKVNAENKQPQANVCCGGFWVSTEGVFLDTQAPPMNGRFETPVAQIVKNYLHGLEKNQGFVSHFSLIRVLGMGLLMNRFTAGILVF